MIIPVASADDPRVAAYRAVKERDLLRGDARFIVEGKITLGRLVEASRFPVESLFLSENRVESLTALLARLDPSVPVYMAPQAVMDGVTGFNIHRGVLAIARRIEEQSVDQVIAALPSGPLTLLVLIGLANHDNVGACFRNAAALGANAVLLDETSCDPLYRKSIRVSSGAALSLPFARSGDGASLLAALETAGIEAWAMTPAHGETLQAITPPERLAIVLGEEGHGLQEDLMARCRRVTIPMAPGADSLNVATAGAIALAQAFARRG